MTRIQISPDKTLENSWLTVYYWFMDIYETLYWFESEKLNSTFTLKYFLIAHF